jgi:hypothetical protein
MKCRAWVVPSPTKRQPDRIKAVADAYARERRDAELYLKQYAARVHGGPEPEIELYVMYSEPPEGHPTAVLCGGDIIVRIAAEEEPYMGGVSAALVIDVKCARCGWTYHGPAIPHTADELSTLLTQYIDALP